MDVRPFFKILFSASLSTLLILSAGLSIGCSGSSDSAFSDVLPTTDSGTGTTSIAISSFLPTQTNLVIKNENSQTFLVSATGTGTLKYLWTLDGAMVGTNSTSLVFSASSYTPGIKTLKVTITDDIGTTSQQWSVKVNGTPTITSATPSLTNLAIRRNSTLNLSVSASDPNSDTLTYTWKVDGAENVITSSSASAEYTPTSLAIGSHTVTVSIKDGTAGDAGTYEVSQSWTVNVNHFEDSCNTIANGQLTNKTCVYTGISAIGNLLDPAVYPSQILLRPTDVFVTTNGNQFIADSSNDVIFYWNRTSSAVSVVGVTVPANTLKIVAGTGGGGGVGTSSSTLAVRTNLSDPSGLYFDGTDLYISDTSNNVVRKVDSSNVISTVLGGGASNVDGAQATTHVCANPWGVVKSGTNLYVACGGSNRVKRVDLSATPPVAYTFAGNGSTTNPTSGNESSPTASPDGTLNLPYGLDLDASGNIYISEYTSCRLRVVNTTGSTITLYGSLTISTGMMRTILGSPTTSACSYVAGAASSTARLFNPRHLRVANNTIYVANYGDHTIVGVNLSASTQAYGTVNISAYNAARIVGNGTAGYLGEGSLANGTRFNQPYAVDVDSTRSELVIADYANLRVRKIGSDYKTGLLMGSGAIRNGSAGNGLIEATSEKMSNPRQLAYDAVTGDLFVTDLSNHRIRKIDKYGQVTTAVGTALGNGNEEDAYPTAVTMNSPIGLSLVGATASFGGHLIYSDSANHRIRFWNRSDSSVTLFGVTIGAGLVATVAGNGTSGNGTSGSALAAALNTPDSITNDGTNLYIADTANHCLKKVDSSGTISVVAGTCGTAGNVNGAVGTGRLSSPAGLAYYLNGTNSGVFIGDRGNSRIKFMRLTGTSAIAGVPVSAGDTNNVACGGAYHDDAIIASNSTCSSPYSVIVVGSKFCFSNYGYHNVRCVDISTGIVTTVMGPLQGIDSAQPKYFPATAVTSTDQNNVPAYFNTAPTLTDSFGGLNSPIGLASKNSGEMFIADWGGQLIRKIFTP